MTTSLHNPGESLESLRAERDAALAELASMRYEHSEVQEIVTSRRAEIELLRAKITEHEATAAADWKTFNDTQADREKWCRDYHAMVAERDAARKALEELRANLGARELEALQWLKQLMKSDQRSTEHNSVLIAMANRLLNSAMPNLRMPTGLTESSSTMAVTSAQCSRWMPHTTGAPTPSMKICRRSSTRQVLYFEECTNWYGAVYCVQ